ncbi:MAG: leucine-rich repeat domain-containing protein [Holosporales bacterium]|jgi:hypothetical protein|nr:leucine-rich repeat domain-containing protein [Holosporales bacterium]
MKKCKILEIISALVLGSLGGPCKAEAMKRFPEAAELFGETFDEFACFRSAVAYRGEYVSLSESGFNVGASNVPCSRARDVVISWDAKTLDMHCWKECQFLQHVPFEAGSRLEWIGPSAFHDSALRSICIPASVKTIWEKCFEGCLQLLSVTFEPGSQLESVKYRAFVKTSFRHICLPRGVEFGVLVFGWSCVRGIDVGGQSANPCSGVYAGTIILKNVEIPNTLRTLPVGCFLECRWLGTVTFEPNSQLCILKKKVFAWSGLQFILLPASVEKIETQCFHRCECLHSVAFEQDSRLHEIEQWAFAESSRAQITLPNGQRYSAEQLNPGWTRPPELDVHRSES